MKRLNMLMGILILAIAGSNSAKGQNPDLVGTWIVDVEQSLQSLQGSELALYNQMSSRSRNILTNTMENRELILLEGGAVRLHLNLDDDPSLELNGSWSYATESNILSIEIDDHFAEYTVGWNGNKRILLEMVGTSSKTFLRKMFYKKK